MTMKKTCFFLAFICLSGHFFGQELFDFENAHWDIVKMNWDEDEFKVSSQKVFQTTSKIGRIDTTGYCYYQLNTSSVFHLNGMDQNQFLIRQDTLTGRVFVKSFMDETKEFLVYDFNVVVGDTFQTILSSQLKGDLIVTQIVNIGTEEKPIRLIEARLNGDGALFKFTEGIGCLNGFLVNLPMDAMNVSILKYCHVNNELVYGLGDDCSSTTELNMR